ncbi:MAG TPA: tetratricopeptide repeat protein [Gemmatales bacterium]|nr:tetratricopeptide repeat protein [Gemmatales bacterium]
MSGIVPLGDRLFEQAQSLRQVGRHEDAVQTLRAAAGFVKAAAAFRALHVATADSYAKLGRYRQARKHLKIALSEEPRDADLHARLGRAWDDDTLGGDGGKALAHLRRAVAIDPTHADHQRDLGRALLGAGNVAAGLKRLEQAWALEPDRLDRLEELIDALIEHGRLQKAPHVLIRARFRHHAAPAFVRLTRHVAHVRAARAQRHNRWTLAHPNRPSAAVLPFLKVRSRPDRKAKPTGDDVVLRLDPKATEHPRLPRRSRSRRVSK